jgi:colanic acid/amylovoran biosynthesis glycosyltransferase
VTVVYLANSFPEAVEPYVGEEIRELRRLGARALPCSVRRPKSAPAELSEWSDETEYLFPLHTITALLATWTLCRHALSLYDLLQRVLAGRESLGRRLKTVAHTWLGAYLAVVARNEGVLHVHVHHGYFSAWIGMVAARILGAGFSMTLHGSDLLLRADYLDTKLANCRFCYTVSEFNRQSIIRRFPQIGADQILLRRLGVDPKEWRPASHVNKGRAFTILSVGRLHAVKNHAFLILMCRLLKSRGMQFHCAIAGEGDERERLEQLILRLDLQDEVELLGHVSRQRLPDLYASADLVALTSHSEGIPVGLMEAMAMNRIVLAPRITGIPELIEDGKDGLLYSANSMEEFLAKLDFVYSRGASLDNLRTAARAKIKTRFHGALNLARFAQDFLNRVEESWAPVTARVQNDCHEDPLLQQI